MIPAIKKIFSILNLSQKREFFLLIFLLFIGAILEMLGIGMLLPVLTSLTGENLSNYIYGEKILIFLSYIGLENKNEILIFFLLLLFLFYFIKTLFLSFAIWHESKFLYNLYANLTTQLFQRYLHQDYLFHVNRNSSKLIQNIIVDTDHFVFVFLFSFIMFITEILIILGISFVLFLIEPEGFSIILLIFGILSIVYLIYTKRFIKDWGIKRKHSQTLSIQHIQQGLRAIKDLKILGLEDKFVSYLKNQNDQFAEVGKKWFFLKNIPKNVLEFIALTALIFFIIIFLQFNNSLENIIITIGIFTVSAFKIIPSVSRLIGTFQNMRFSWISLDTIESDLSLKINDKLKVNFNKKKLLFEKNICLKNLSFHYQYKDKLILKNINFEIPVNKTIGISGASGVGKTTLVDLIIGILKPSEGEILVDGNNINFTLREWQNNIGYIPQFIYLSDDSIKKNIALGVNEEEIDMNKIESAVHNSQCSEFIKNLPKKLDTTIGEQGIRLSGGQRQRIGIARALYNNPNLLVMDEATSSLDEKTENEIINSINLMRGKKTIIISAHKKSILKECDLIYKIEDNNIIKLQD